MHFPFCFTINAVVSLHQILSENGKPLAATPEWNFHFQMKYPYWECSLGFLSSTWGYIIHFSKEIIAWMWTCPGLSTTFRVGGTPFHCSNFNFLCPHSAQELWKYAYNWWSFWQMSIYAGKPRSGKRVGILSCLPNKGNCILNPYAALTCGHLAANSQKNFGGRGYINLCQFIGHIWIFDAFCRSGSVRGLTHFDALGA